MKHLLFGCLLIMISAKVEAQQLGCYVDFSNPTVCRSTNIPIGEWSDIESVNIQRYGYTVGLLFNTIKAMDKNWHETMDGWKQCTDEYAKLGTAYDQCYNTVNLCNNDYNVLYSIYEQQLLAIAKLKKQVRRLRRLAR